MSTHDQTPSFPPPPGAQPPPPAPEPAPKKSWFARHKVLSAVLGILLLFVLVNALGDDDTTTPAAADKTSSETAAHASGEEGADPSASSKGSTADGSDVDDEAAEKEAAEKKAAEEKAAQEKADKEAAEKKAAEEAAATPGIGDVVTVGDFEVTVTGVEDGFDYVGPADWGEAAQGTFVKVLLTVKNNGKSAEYFHDSEQKLIDEQDREHSTSSAAFYMDEENLWLTEINPGNTATGALLYDIPVDATPVKITLSSGFFGKTAEVSLAP